MEQSNTGLPEFKIANLFQDIEMLKNVQSLAIKILEDDENLEKPENKVLKQSIQKKFRERIEIWVSILFCIKTRLKQKILKRKRGKYDKF